MTAPVSTVLDGAIAQAREWSASSGDDWRLSKAQVVALADAAEGGRVAQAAVRAAVRLLADADECGSTHVRIDALRAVLLFGRAS
jgi:hypothetical protein